MKRWSLYYSTAEDYIMPVSDWAMVFSSPMFRRRLDPDYLAKSEEYLAIYHTELKELGKASPFWQFPFVASLGVVSLARYQVVGNYTRYEEAVLNELKDAHVRIVADITQPGSRRNNHLIWAAPGSGKTYFVQQIAASLAGECLYLELNLAKLSREQMQAGLETLPGQAAPCLCLVDEIDARQEETWPYELLLPYLDLAVEGRGQAVFLLAGSSGYSLEGMKQRIAARPKGKDLLNRIPTENEFVIPPLSFGDRILVVLSQFIQAGKESGRSIRSVEKLGLYYIALSSRLANARQLHEFALRAVERMPRGDDRVKYDQLFEPGDPENKHFWLEVASVAKDMVNRFVIVED